MLNFFRGYSKSKGWIVGYLIETDSFTFFLNPKKENCDEIEPATLCRCVDMEDVNGNAIFVNDIIHLCHKDHPLWEDYTNYQVKETKHCLKAVNLKDKTEFIFGDVRSLKYAYRIVGNIFDGKDYAGDYNAKRNVFGRKN